MEELLNIVNENDEIIGQKTRSLIHKDGLLHREIHVYFITPNKEVIFQHRAKDKDTYPDLLDATVGGHVEIGDDYSQTAIKEVEEETGLKIRASDLIFLNKIQRRSEDKATGKINNAIRQSYLYIFKGNINDLRVEEGKAIGFELWSLDKLFNLSEIENHRFIPYVIKFLQEELPKFLIDIYSK